MYLLGACVESPSALTPRAARSTPSTLPDYLSLFFWLCTTQGYIRVLTERVLNDTASRRHTGASGVLAPDHKRLHSACGAFRPLVASLAALAPGSLQPVRDTYSCAINMLLRREVRACAGCNLTSPTTTPPRTAIAVRETANTYGAEAFPGSTCSAAQASLTSHGVGTVVGAGAGVHERAAG